MVDVSTY
jgi:MIP family channel proteins